MQLKTILNRVERFKSFVYGKARWVEDAAGAAIEVEVLARKTVKLTELLQYNCSFANSG